jgi:hypothetical protein
MKTLSEQLSDLALKIRQVEDVAAAIRAKNQAALESQRKQVKARIDKGKAQAKSHGATSKNEARRWWDEVRGHISKRFDEMRAKRVEHLAERDLRESERRADDAEQDASDAIAFASWAIDQAEYAVIDAVAARAETDELAAAIAGSPTGGS